MKQSISRGRLLKQLVLMLASILIIGVQSVKLNENKRHQSVSSRKMTEYDKEFSNDVCLNSDGTYGTCDTSLFPTCSGDESICYNRRPRRDLFYTDIRQPHFYIDYDSILCYPQDYNGCSSCSPGRFCKTENRCILEDRNYPCEKWL